MNTQTNPKIAAGDRVPVGQKLAYAAGGSVEMLSGASVGTMWMPVFNLGFGISPGILGMIGVIYRIWDAVTDPVVGNMSDNTRTRWGRRRPYILVGAVLVALTTPMLWRMSPSWSEMGMLVYITVIGLLLHTSLSVWAMPYNSLMLEMTPNYDELRTFRRREGNINAVFSWFFKFGSTIAMGLSGFILEWTGFDAKAGDQPQAVLQRMLFLYVLLPAVFWVIAVLLIRIYPLNRKTMAGIRGELEARRGAV